MKKSLLLINLALLAACSAGGSKEEESTPPPAQAVTREESGQHSDVQQAQPAGHTAPVGSPADEAPIADPARPVGARAHYHNAPEQSALDSLKAAKTKKKK